MTEKIVVIPGSAWQIPIVKKIKEMGYSALVVNPYEDSPAFAYADGHLQADMFNENAVLDYCKKEDVSAILSEECDIAMPALAKYASELGLLALSSKSARLFTDKHMMRKFGAEHKLPVPEFKECYSTQEAVEFFNIVNKKMIMKPLDGNSSRGVFTIENEEDIEKNFDETIKYSRIEKAVLLERYIDGVEFTIDGIKTPQRHYSLAISQKKHFAHNLNIASELYFAHENANFDYDLLRETNDAFVNAAGLEFGLTHAEYKYENGVFYLIEIAARGGGNLISSDIVPFMSGIDNYEYLVNCSLGAITSPDFSITQEYKNRASVLKFMDTNGRTGKVKRIEGEDFLKNCKAIDRYQFNFAVGDTISPAENDAKRVGFYIACCESKKELDEIMHQVDENVRIVLE